MVFCKLIILLVTFIVWDLNFGVNKVSGQAYAFISQEWMGDHPMWNRRTKGFFLGVTRLSTEPDISTKKIPVPFIIETKFYDTGRQIKNKRIKNGNKNKSSLVVFNKLYREIGDLVKQLKDYERSLREKGNPAEKSIRNMTTTRKPWTTYIEGVFVNKTKEWSYFRTFGYELSKLLMEKPDWVVKRLWGAMETYLVQELLQQGDLEHIGNINERKLKDFVQAINFAPPIFQSAYANIYMDHMLNYSLFLPDFRSIIQTVESMYMPYEGESLLHSLSLIYDYPHNVSITATDVVRDVVHAILRPYRRLAASVERANLIKAIENAITKRFYERQGENEDKNTLRTQNATKHFERKEIINSKVMKVRNDDDYYLNDDDEEKNLSYSDDEDNLKSKLYVALAHGTVSSDIK